MERLLGISDPLLRSCSEPLRQHLQVSGHTGAAPAGAGWDAAALGPACARGWLHAVSPALQQQGTLVSRPCLQPSVQALREHTEQLFLRSGACAVQLEHAQSLLAQFSEAHEELSPWLEETQVVGVQLSPNAISYEAFKEQQALLQVRAGWPQLGQGEGEGEDRDTLCHPAGSGAERRWCSVRSAMGRSGHRCGDCTQRARARATGSRARAWVQAQPSGSTRVHPHVPCPGPVRAHGLSSALSACGRPSRSTGP